MHQSPVFVFYDVIHYDVLLYDVLLFDVLLYNFYPTMFYPTMFYLRSIVVESWYRQWSRRVVTGEYAEAWLRDPIQKWELNTKTFFI